MGYGVEDDGQSYDDDFGEEQSEEQLDYRERQGAFDMRVTGGFAQGHVADQELQQEAPVQAAQVEGLTQSKLNEKGGFVTIGEIEELPTANFKSSIAHLNQDSHYAA